MNHWLRGLAGGRWESWFWIWSLQMHWEWNDIWGRMEPFKGAWAEVMFRTQEGGCGSSITGSPAVLIVCTKGNVILFPPLIVIMIWSCIWSGAKVMLLKWGWESPAMVTERQIFCLLPLLRTPGQQSSALRAKLEFFATGHQTHCP